MSPTATITRASSAKLGKRKAQAGGQNHEMENESNEAEPSDVSKKKAKNAASQSELESAIVQDVLQDVRMNIDESVRSPIANRLAQFEMEKVNKASNPSKSTKGPGKQLPKHEKHETSSKKKNEVKQKDSSKGTALGVVGVRRSKRLNGGGPPSDPGDDGPDGLPDESSGDETYSLITSNGDGINASADEGGSSPDDDDSNYDDHGDGSNCSDFESQSSGGSDDVVEVKALFTNPFKISPFDGKDWTTYREDIRAVAERQGVWNIMCGKEVSPNKSVKPKKYADFKKRAAIANELLITSLDKSSFGEVQLVGASICNSTIYDGKANVNLISQTRMKEQFGLLAEYSLDNDYCWLVNGEVKIEFALVDGMYRHIAKLVKFRSRPVLYTSTPVEENKSELRKWHNRLAHANMDVVKAM
ncbi:hypothetical protein AC1031_013798 [Aphanomyces cochlioides]|nr:hypothetical protein AC1031_013798 [Aphanomyces cochlioides]